MFCIKRDPAKVLGSAVARSTQTLGCFFGTMTLTYPCPCCGHLVFDEPPGSYDICPICFWEDDLSQLRFPMTGGANHVSLIDGQLNFERYGVCETRFQSKVRAVASSDVRDSDWRPIDEARDNIEAPVPGVEYGETYPADCTRLYYWRRSYWRK